MMTWVVRIPKRSDFCGCPPCPLCYNWATEQPAGRVQDKWVQEIIDGMSKFTEDMLGSKTPTANEQQVLKDAAEAIHVSNLGFHDRVDAELKAADAAQHTERQMADFLAKKREDAARPPEMKAGPCLDDMDLSKLNEPPPEPRVTWVSYIDSSSFFTSGYIEEAMKNISKGPSFEVFTEKVPLDDRDKRRIQAEADAKKRMKAQARGYAKVGRYTSNPCASEKP